MIAWPRVARAFHAALPTILPTVVVYNGEPVPNPPADQRFLTVGFVDGEDSAGPFNQEQGDVDGLRAEDGEVRCELVSWVGDDDYATVLDDVLALLDQLDAGLRADQTLGGALLAGTSLLLAGDLVPRKSNGTAIRVPFSVQYSTRTP